MVLKTKCNKSDRKKIIQTRVLAVLNEDALFKCLFFPVKLFHTGIKATNEKSNKIKKSNKGFITVQKGLRILQNHRVLSS